MTRRDVLQSLGLGALALSVGSTISRRAVAAGESTGAMRREYVLGPLPYAYGALAPGIEEGVLRIHHTKHHAGYVSRDWGRDSRSYVDYLTHGHGRCADRRRH